MRPIVLAIALVAAAPALAADAPQGKACLVFRQIEDQRIPDAHTIYFRANRQWYRSDLGADCPGLGPRTAITIRSPSSDLCVGEPMTVIDPIDKSARGTCSVGRFVAVDDAPRVRR